MNTEDFETVFPRSKKETKPIGLKFDSDKTQWNMFDSLWKPLEYVCRVLMYGDKKYTQTLEDGTVIRGKDNWKIVQNKRDRYYDGLMRHIMQWRLGEKNDPETGLPHLAHACCCALFLMWSDDNEG